MKAGSMSSPQVTVLLPFHRDDAFFREALRSVLDSVGCDLEVLLVADDRAKAALPALRVEFDDPRIRFSENPGNGLVSALNHGLEIASHELVARMDSDDVCLPTRFQRQAEVLASESSVALVGSQLEIICQHGTVLGQSRYPRSLGRGTKPYLAKVAHPSVMFRKSLVVQAGGYRGEFEAAEDLDLWNRLLELGGFMNLDTRLLRYRVHKDQVSNTQANRQLRNSYLAGLSAILDSTHPKWRASIGNAETLAEYLRRQKALEREQTLNPETQTKLDGINRYFEFQSLIVERNFAGLIKLFSRSLHTAAAWIVLRELVTRQVIGPVFDLSKCQACR